MKRSLFLISLFALAVAGCGDKPPEKKPIVAPPAAPAKPKEQAPTPPPPPAEKAPDAPKADTGGAPSAFPAPGPDASPPAMDMGKDMMKK